MDRLGCLWPESTQCAPCDFGANRHAARVGDFSAGTFWEDCWIGWRRKLTAVKQTKVQGHFQ